MLVTNGSGGADGVALRFPFRFVGGLLAGVVLCASHVAAQPVVFEEVGPSSGILAYQPAPGMSTGVAVADYDDDGDADIFVPTGFGHPDRLYRNLGDGTFEEIAAAAGLANTQNNRSALWFDVDGDNDLDLAVLSDAFQRQSIPAQNELRLYRNDGASGFVDVSVASGVAGLFSDEYQMQAGGMAAGDLDGDGDLDLVAGLWENRTHVYLNGGDWTFLEVGEACGMGVGVGTAWQPVIHDFDKDGRLDVLFSYDFGPNNLWMNRGDPGALPVFVDEAPAAGIDTAFNEMGIAPGDPDSDGDLDFYMTNIYGFGPNGQGLEHNVLFRDDSGLDGLAYTEIAQSIGVGDGGIGWGAVFADFDLDGWQDLAEANTFEFPTAVPTKLWRHIGVAGIAYEDISAASGFATTEPSTSLIAFDRDGDGDLDLLSPTMTGTLRLLDNTLGHAAASTNWLGVKLRAPGMNRRGIGSVVRAHLNDGRVMTRLITAGSSFAGQTPAMAHFGLGDVTGVDRVEVTWPDGTSSVLEEVIAGDVITIESPCPCGAMVFDTDGDGRNEIDDLHAAHASPVDLNADGMADSEDIRCVERFLRRNERRRTSP
ncbi:MAG: CRTAC1 family protein [Phycisphaerales bacterium]